MSGQIEGKNSVLEALKAGRPIDKILISTNIARHSTVAEIMYLSKQKGIPVIHTEKAKLDRMSETGSHQGIIAVALEKQYVEVEDLLESAKKKGEEPFIILLDGIEDPHNLGAVIRTAEAAGAHGIVIPKRRSAGLSATVSKTSAGAIEHLPVARVANISDVILKLKKAKVWVVGIENSAEKSFTDFDYKLPVAIVIGGEGGGISRLVKENCDELVSIPMKGKISSLNASVAAAVVMYEILRQRSR